MKRCDNCFENNSDGATNCVICGEPLAVPQLGMDEDTPVSSGSTPVGMSMDEERSALEAFEGSDIAIAIQEYAEENGEGVDENIDVPVVELVEDDWADEAVHGTSTMDENSDEMNDVEDTNVDDMNDDGMNVDGMNVDGMNIDGMNSDESADGVNSDEMNADDIDMSVSSENNVDSGCGTAVATGQVVLQIFHDEEPRVVHSYAIVHDITLIGREDPHRDVFPDLDLGRLEKDGVSSGHVSRQHMRLLRDGNNFFLFVYKGTTGTQVCSSLVDPSQYGKRFPIALGDRIVLGGKVRMKLTTQD